MKRNTSSDNSSSSIAYRYLIVLGLLAILSTVSYKILEKTTSKLETSAAVISASSRQSMLSQRIANLSLLLVNKKQTAERIRIREDLNNAINMMETYHKGLTKGSEKMKLPSNLSSRVASMYFDEPMKLDSFIVKYISEAKALAVTPDESLNLSNNHLSFILSSNNHLLRGLNELLHLYQIESEWNTKRLKSIETVILIAYLSVLVFMGILVFYPMTKRIKQEMNKLKEAEAYTRAIVETAADSVITADEKGRIESFNRAAEQLFGYLSQDVADKNIKSLISEINSKANGAGINNLRSGEMIGRRKDGSNFPADLSVSYTKLNDRRIYICIVRDITERKRAEEALLNAHDTLELRVKERTSELSKTNALLKQEIAERKHAEEALREGERRFRTMADTAPVMIWMTGNDKLNSYFNKGWLEFRGRTLGEEVGNGWLDGVHPDDRQSFVEMRSTSFNSRREFKAEYRLKQSDGNYRWVLDHGTPRFLEDRSFAGYIGSVIDITDRKRAEEEMYRAQKIESLGSLAGGIAHDFNNILTAIMSNASLARKYVSSGDAVFKRLLEIEKASLRAKNLTQRFLTFARGGDPIKNTVSIAELLKDSVGMTVRDSSYQCKISIPKKLWPVDIDEGQMSQVLSNLLSNSMQSMMGGGEITVKAENVKVKLDNMPNAEDQKFVKVSINDGGVGIPKENLQKIFDPYFTTKKESNGLGLATSYSIIKKHDGLITVDSEMGKGSTFYVYLPASANAVEMVDERDQFDGAEHGKAAEHCGRILLMDDEEMIREVAGKVLNFIGYEVEFAEDGAKAVDLYQKTFRSGDTYDVVILDLTVPGGMGGEEAIKRLLRIDPHVKAIVSSGYSDNPVMSTYEKYGFMGVIEKPYNVKELRDVLNSVMSQH